METWQNAMKAIKVEYPYPMYNSHDQEKILKQRGFKYPKEFQKLDIESAKEDKQREAEESKEDESEVSNKPLTGEQVAEQLGIKYTVYRIWLKEHLHTRSQTIKLMAHSSLLTLMKQKCD